MRTRCFHLTFFLLICVSIPLTTTAQTVNILDPNLRAIIASTLGKVSGDPITVVDMETLDGIEAEAASIADLTGIEFALNLTELNLWDNSISDISFLAGLTNLKQLILGENVISDISPLVELTNLTQLDLRENSISDISPLAGLTNLTTLFLEDNLISNISSVIRLINLIELDLNYNSISDISSLALLTSLTRLALEENSISDISPLAGLTNLTHLDLDYNSVSDISVISGFTNLEALRLAGNPISDISPLAGLTNLTRLYFGRNLISDISPLERLTNLESLYIGTNSISDISVVSGLTNLRSLELESNPISDISPLAGLTNLEWLYLWDNSISDISPLINLTNLRELYLSHNLISDLSALVANTGLAAEDVIALRGNPLNYQSINTHIPFLKNRGVRLRLNYRTPATIVKISGYQRGSPSATLKPFVVEVRDEYGSAFEGVPVTFAVTAGDGTLSAIHTTTDENGRAQSTLTLGQNLGVHTISATAAGWVIDDPAIFSVISDTEPPPITTDVNGDGIANILDLVLVASAFGSEGPDLPTDVNGDRAVNILDLVWVADALGAGGAAPSLQPQTLEMLTAEDVKLWLSQAHELDLTEPTTLRGILVLEQLLAALPPPETLLLPNYPNPFNPETWIPYHLAKDSDVTLTIYNTDGQPVRRLPLGHQPAGTYQTRSRAAYWDGKDELGEPVASGAYFYTLSAGNYSATRKMLILK